MENSENESKINLKGASRKMDNRPIGLLDSGLGGLTVVKKVIEKMPNEKTIFIGDQAHMPYGDRPKEEIISLTRHLVRFLLDQDVKIIIFACNTATATAMKVIAPEIDRQIIGVIQSGALAAAQTTKTKKVAVIGTTATVNSEAYVDEIKARDHEIQVSQLAAPLLAPLVEADEGPEIRQKVVEKSLAPLKADTFDTLVLGCTHYPIIASEIRSVVSPKTMLVDPADQVSQYTQNVLRRDGLLADDKQIPDHRYYTTGQAAKFTKVARQWLNDPSLETLHVD
mgnify:FL=1